MHTCTFLSAFLSLTLALAAVGTSLDARPREDVVQLSAMGSQMSASANGSAGNSASGSANASEYGCVDNSAGGSLSAYSALWSGEFDKTDWEIVVGYVNKSWRCTYSVGSWREDFFGDPEAQYFHGFQIGGVYTPSFDWGLGLRTGLFMEFYSSRSKMITDWCSSFGEFDLYIPLHASYRIPFNAESCLNLFGGMGFQWAASGQYFKQIGTAWTWWRRPVPVVASTKQVYGYGWPQQVNWQAECGINLRYWRLQLSFTYSFGIVEHGIENSFDGGKTYETASKSRQDKMQASVAFLF